MYLPVSASFWLDVYLNKGWWGGDLILITDPPYLITHLCFFKGQIKGDHGYRYKSHVNFFIRIICHPFPFFPPLGEKKRKRKKESIIKSLNDKELTVRFRGKWFQSCWPVETQRKSPADLINSSLSSCRGAEGKQFLREEPITTTRLK